ncbi:MAG: hypothetical protein BBJ57_06245 [Desulfobacterales bacterium PC51MH44]|nr:MAG: hypothetical protein BBJ57_06245 [Desulfobacterales bacterium PC51MH44]
MATESPFLDQRLRDSGMNVRHIKAALGSQEDVQHTLSLAKEIGKNREVISQIVRAGGIGVNVHYIPVHLHPFYKDKFNTGPGLCPVAEAAYE